MSTLRPSKQQAQAVKLWLQGKNYREIAEVVKRSEATVKLWIKAEKQRQASENSPTKELVENPRKFEYIQALESFGVAAMKMLTAQAELLANPDYIRNKDTSEVIQHTREITRTLERFVQLHRPPDTAAGHGALPAPSDGEVVIPELVDEGSSA